MIAFDVEAIFRHFGGPNEVLSRLDAVDPDHEHKLSYPSVQMWRQRGTIPTRWVAAVLYCLEQSGRHTKDFFLRIQDTEDELGLYPPVKRPVKHRVKKRKLKRRDRAA